MERRYVKESDGVDDFAKAVEKHNREFPEIEEFFIMTASAARHGSQTIGASVSARATTLVSVIAQMLSTMSETDVDGLNLPTSDDTKHPWVLVTRKKAHDTVMGSIYGGIMIGAILMTGFLWAVGGLAF